MKETTNDWLLAAEDDLLAAKTLLGEDRLTNLVAFHCQHCLEKCFKAIIEDQDKPSIKSHDLIRLQLNAEVQLSESETIMIGIINEVYINARYRGDLGLLPKGKPTIAEVEGFIQFCDILFVRIKHQIG